jgi:hypothetical protein
LFLLLILMMDIDKTRMLIDDHNRYDSKINRFRSKILSYEEKQRTVINQLLEPFCSVNHLHDDRIRNIQSCIQFHQNNETPRNLKLKKEKKEPKIAKHSQKSVKKEKTSKSTKSSKNSKRDRQMEIEELKKLHHVFDKTKILPKAPFNKEDLQWIAENSDFKDVIEMIDEKPQFQKEKELLGQLIDKFRVLSKSKRNILMREDVLQSSRKKPRHS